MEPGQFIRNTKTDGYSDRIGAEDAFCSIPNVTGVFDFRLIESDLTIASGMLQLPIRLLNGRHFGSGGGYGIAHMIYHHAPAMSLWDFYSVQDYVEHVIDGFDAVYAGHKNRYIVVRRKEPALAVDRLLILELSSRRDYYSVVTGWPQSARRPVNGELVAEYVKKDAAMVWECRAPHSKGPGTAQSDATAD